MSTTGSHQLDADQQTVVDLKDVNALVLAGPGCGKTHILSQRIIAAHCRDNVPFDDMVCLTFTNRASREMNSRICAELGYRPEGLYVGNIHRFCIRLLFDNNIIPRDYSIFDEDDQEIWFGEALGIKSAGQQKRITDLAMLLYQQEHEFPPSLLRKLPTLPTAAEITAATDYIEYKRLNHLIDFDDVILFAYNALVHNTGEPLLHTCYHWVQVDEVQDLTPLQLAIIDMITSAEGSTVVYFGDEQQAIFEFIGAGGPALDRLKQRYHSSIYRLRRNYRAPAYLVNLCNDYAINCLDNAADELPKVDDGAKAPTGALELLHSSPYNLDLAVAAKVRQWAKEQPEERIAVLVRTNNDAEHLSQLFTSHRLEHMLVSRKDLFKQVPYKTLFAHFAVIDNPFKMLEWSRLLYQTKAVHTMSEARSLVYRLSSVGATLEDMFDEDKLTELGRFAAVNEDEDVVIFDTETTGLNVFEDDIVQIAAVRYHKGKPIEGGQFVTFLKTSKLLPDKLHNGMPNPLLEIYPKAEKQEPCDALRDFLKFAEGAVLCGHNVDFDIAILQNCCERYLGDGLPIDLLFRPVDTMRIARLLLPTLGHYSLSALIEYFKIDGVNSHVAGDDVDATAKLIDALMPIAKETLKLQAVLFNSPILDRASQRLRQSYGDIYYHSRNLRNIGQLCAANSLCGEMEYVYQQMVNRNFIRPIDRLPSILKFIRSAIIEYIAERRFRNQLSRHINELRTFSESDLLNAGTVEERITIITVHKAKGLEFDNVVVHDAGGRYWGDAHDNARVLYVAISRAKKRLAVFYDGHLNESLLFVNHHFEKIPSDQVEASALLERLYRR